MAIASSARGTKFIMLSNIRERRLGVFQYLIIYEKEIISETKSLSLSLSNIKKLRLVNYVILSILRLHFDLDYKIFESYL